MIKLQHTLNSARPRPSITAGLQFPNLLVRQDGLSPSISTFYECQAYFLPCSDGPEESVVIPTRVRLSVGSQSCSLTAQAADAGVAGS